MKGRTVSFRFLVSHRSFSPLVCCLDLLTQVCRDARSGSARGVDVECWGRTRMPELRIRIHDPMETKRNFVPALRMNYASVTPKTATSRFKLTLQGPEVINLIFFLFCSDHWLHLGSWRSPWSHLGANAYDEQNCDPHESALTHEKLAHRCAFKQFRELFSYISRLA